MLLLQATAMIDLSNLITSREASRRLGIHEESLRRIIRIGTLPAEKIGGQWYVDKDKLAAFASIYDHKTGKRNYMI